MPFHAGYVVCHCPLSYVRVLVVVLVQLVVGLELVKPSELVTEVVGVVKAVVGTDAVKLADVDTGWVVPVAGLALDV